MSLSLRAYSRGVNVSNMIMRSGMFNIRDFMGVGGDHVHRHAQEHVQNHGHGGMDICGR